MKCTNFLRGLMYYGLTVMVAIACLPTTIIAAPTNNPFDPQPMHTVYGLDKYFKEKDLGEIRFSLSPFYTNANTARDSSGGKVSGGDRLGKWNMFALGYGQNAAPVTKPLVDGGNNYPTLAASYNTMIAVTKQANSTTQAVGIGGSPAGVPAPAILSKNRYEIGGSGLVETSFDPDDDTFAFLSVPAHYERMGVRGELSFDFGFGLGVTFKGGAAEVRNHATGFAIEDQFQLDAKTNAPAAGRAPNFKSGLVVTGDSAPAASDIPSLLTDASALYNAFFEQNIRSAIAKDLGLSLAHYRETVMEDVHMQLHWHLPFDIYDKRGDISTIVIPMFAVGAWLPISSGRDQNKVFSVPATNDGFVGVTADFSLGFDFPVLPNKNGESLQINLGGGLTYFNEKTVKNYRFASSKYQVGMIPWTIDSIKKKPGITWYLNASMRAEEFTDGLSLYADYMYTAHEQDTFSIAKAAEEPYKTFATGGQAAEEERSSWKTQQAQVGISYAVNSDLRFGFAVQAPIQGVRVMRTVTVMGTVTIAF
jgi:hypothetical protein